VIILDTHIWIWWVHGDPKLPSNYYSFIQSHLPNGLGICSISCWEVAMLAERGRLTLPVPVDHWLWIALHYPGVSLLPLLPEVSVESTRLPGTFHRDPADQIIVATSRIYGCPLVTMDQRIRAYPHINLAP
jgi:PIN domain nuclease of toxin-antitoxin system